MIFSTIIDNLRQERLRRGLTVEQAARMAGWKSPAILYELESKEGNPTVATIERYASALGLEGMNLMLTTPNAPRVLTLYNYAGGAGKSSSTRDLGYAMSQKGFKVLLIDCDPQHSLTSWLGHRGAPLSSTLYDALLHPDPDTAPIPDPLEAYGMHLYPSHDDLTHLENELLKHGPADVLALKKIIPYVGRGYDFVLIDSPPTLGFFTHMAVAAADRLVVPVTVDAKGLEGVAKVNEHVSTRFRRNNTKIRVAMYLLNQYDPRTSEAKSYLEVITDFLSPIAAVSSPIHALPKPYQQAVTVCQPIALMNSGKAATQQIEAATDLLLKSLEIQVTAHA